MFLIIQNDPHCPEGSCGSTLRSLGEPFTVSAAFDGCEFPHPRSLTGIIVLGGDMSVYETGRFPYLDDVRRFMSQAIEHGTPLLGICLGGQLLAQAAGGTVSSPSPHGEHGIASVEIAAAASDDPLFQGVSSPFVTFQLHNDSFTLPPGGILLARSLACPVQAFRLNEHAYGVQFHPEVDRSIVTGWDRLPAPPTDLLSGFLSAENAFNAASRRIISNFVTLALRRRSP